MWSLKLRYLLMLGECTTPAYIKSNGDCACGFFIPKNLTWREAADECYSHGARLPETYTAEENKDIFDLKVGRFFTCFLTVLTFFTFS